ncbi:hypothetical protein QJS10_CPA05g01669 [Acorus calamus]|uniref:Reverse transcriptase n=1 Tax=Acorus calamus TaxID=4465 RepID=A0AAV9EW76_ACOCL|nr:hypothetical protein QJS10_CPA05g01669 [Acorus calamus]
MGMFQQKLRNLQRSLRQWHRSQIGNLQVRVHEAHQQLQQLMELESHQSVDSPISDSIRSASNKLSALQRQSEMYWAQRARIQWLKEGDKNTRYFQHRVQRRRIRNRINMVRTSEGIIINDQEQIHHYVEKFFEEHWTSRQHSVIQIPENLLSRRVPMEMAAQLILPFTEEEVEWAVRRLPFNKAPGPDGFPGEFYKAFWPIIKNDLVRAVRNFHDTSSLPFSWGSSHIVLIPKDIYPALNHILYADDLLIVGIAKPSQCVLIRDILKEAQELTAQLNESTLLQLEKVIRGFLWSDGINLRPIHLVHWEAITAERSRGGLGIRRLTFLKKAILAKLAFRFLLCPSLVGQHMHIKYNWVVNPWEVSPRKNSSSVWKALCKGLQLIRLHVRLIPGDLGSTNLLKDPWFMPVPFSRIPTFINMEEARLDYSILDVVQNNQWSVSILKRVLPDYWVDQIKLQPVPNITQDGRPRWVWEGSCSDKPSTRELYTLLNPLPRSHEEVGWKIIWRIPVIPKVQIFVWKLAWESVNSSTHEAGAAFVVYARDVNSLNGRVVGAGFTGWPWSAPIRMEAEAIRLGVQFARKKGLQNLVELMSLLQGRMNGPASLQQTISAIRECDLSEDKIIFCKVNRTHVRAAEVLALHARWTQEHAISDALSNDSIRSLLLPVMDSIKECIGVLNHFVIVNS